MSCFYWREKKTKEYATGRVTNCINAICWVGGESPLLVKKFEMCSVSRSVERARAKRMVAGLSEEGQLQGCVSQKKQQMRVGPPSLGRSIRIRTDKKECVYVRGQPAVAEAAAAAAACCGYLLYLYIEQEVGWRQLFSKESGGMRNNFGP